MLFPKSWGYAVRALIFLDENQRDGYLLVPEIAEKKAIPAPFLAKILGILAAAGLLKSVRGRNGGFRLVKQTDRISLQEIMDILEPHSEDECILGNGKCIGSDDCPIHDSWALLREEIDQFLENTTIADLQKNPDIISNKL